MTEIDVDISFGPVVALDITQASVGELLIAGPAKLCGWSLLESTGGAAATCTFTSGQMIVGQSGMISGQDDNHNLPGAGVICPQGISISAITGAFTGCVYVRYYKP